MYQRMSLQARLSLFISMLLCVALIASVAAVISFSPRQLADEHDASMRLARELAVALNRSLEQHPDAEQVVRSLLAGLPPFEPGRLSFLPEGKTADISEVAPQNVPGVPQWFSHFLTDRFPVERIPVVVRGQHMGDMVFSPDLSADIREKWVSVLAVIFLGVVLGLTTSIVAYFTVRQTLKPLRQLETSLTHMQSGHYEISLTDDAPPEIARSLTELKTLSGALRTLTDENRSLLRRIVTVQDQERSDLARELHDELGPQLFAIRASAVAVDTDDKTQSDAAVQRLVQSVENLQETNRRILDRLRPMHIQELGLLRSLRGLVHNAQVQASEIRFMAHFDPSADDLDVLSARTVYRLAQEGLTNVLRHARATKVTVAVRIEDASASIELSDNGCGWPGTLVYGRGLTGMRERVLALSGTFQFHRLADCTVLRATISREPPINRKS